MEPARPSAGDRQGRGRHSRQHARLSSTADARRETHLGGAASAATRCSTRPVDSAGPRLAEDRLERSLASSTSSSRFCTVRMARTARCRDCSSWRTCPTSARACWRRRSGMDKAAMKLRVRGRRDCRSATTRSCSGATGSATSARRCRRVVDRARFPRVREAGEPGIERRHLEGEARRGAAHGDRAGRRVRSRRSSSKPRCRRRARSRCAVLGNDEPEASVPGEIIPSRRVLRLRSEISERRTRATSSRRRSRNAHTQEIRPLAVAAFKALDCAGMARVDFLLGGRQVGIAAS